MLSLLYFAFPDALENHLHGLDGAVGVEDEAIDAGDAVVAVGLFERTTVVDEEGPVFPVEQCTFGVGIPTCEDRVATGLFLLRISRRCDATQ